MKNTGSSGGGKEGKREDVKAQMEHAEKRGGRSFSLDSDSCHTLMPTAQPGKKERKKQKEHWELDRGIMIDVFSWAFTRDI